MAGADAVGRARVDLATKQEATKLFSANGDHGFGRNAA